MQLIKRLSPLMGLLILPGLIACTEPNETRGTTAAAQTRQVEQLVVYKNPTCGCCQKWIDHLSVTGFDTEINHPADLNVIKDRFQVANNLRSCHTAVSEQGFVFEGHIPARYIHQFLANPPQDALGLAMPAMPVGSPGMEVGDRFMPYQVLLLKKDGGTEVFASVDNAAQQFEEANQP